MASSSSSSSNSWNYDVFLSFKGETRNTFVSHLYAALSRKGIHAYKDDETLPRGESISPALLEAIEGSRIAVIVFSENYADSPWCLEELEHIMKCKVDRGQTVMPIFYHLVPSDVRKQKRKYEEAFSRHDSENGRVNSWRKALTDAGNLSGWVIDGKRDENKLIEEVVECLLNGLRPLDSNFDEGFVGMTSRIEDLISKLEMESDDVRMVGIWGVGGGGKTTLASCVYDKISNKFSCGCFIQNIREESSASNGLQKLQQTLLNRVVGNTVEIERVEDGKRLIKSRLSHKKVLIVLDDVDKLEQLEALAGSYDWFGGGSKIVITTRNNHLLEAHFRNAERGISVVEVSLLDDVSAEKLFRKHAFRETNPYISIKDYEVFSKEVISYADGLPLALKVLGCHFCDKNKEEWESELKSMKGNPREGILEILKISYDGLTRGEKELFLDIACFYAGKRKDLAMKVLDACHLHAEMRVKVLMQKALLTVDDYAMIGMHDLIQEMGHYIVRGEHPDNPERHSRVWKVDDVEEICEMFATTENHIIEALPKFSEDYAILDSLPMALSNMKKLRWIDWRYCPATSLPTTFPPMGIRYLRLSNSSVVKLWENEKRLRSLKVMDLSLSAKLIKIPDVTGLTRLEKLILRGCLNLKEIHPSIGSHKGLVYLDMSSCSRLELFPPITNMQKLEVLILHYCERLCKFPEMQMVMGSLKHLNLRGCRLEVVPSSFQDCCTRLETLDLSRNKFSGIGWSLAQLTHLKSLLLSANSELEQLPDLPSSLAILEAYSCPLLEIVDGFSSNCKWLWRVELESDGRRGLIGLEKIVQSMLKGNAVEDYFMSITLGEVDVPEWSYQRYEKFTLQLPLNWDNDFTGFLIRSASSNRYSNRHVNIGVVLEMQKDDKSQMVLEMQKDDETQKVIDFISHVWYISFSSLRRASASRWKSIEAYSQISVYIEEHRFVVELVPWRKEAKGDYDSIRRAHDTTEYWDHEEMFEISSRDPILYNGDGSVRSLFKFGDRFNISWHNFPIFYK